MRELPIRRRRIELVVGAVLLTAFVHLAVPAGPHGWHWLHLVAQKLYLVPIVLAAAWLGPLGALITTLGASVFFAAHIARDWRGFAMVQADQVAETANFWIVGAVAAVLFRRERRALDEVKVAHQETLTALAASLEALARSLLMSLAKFARALMPDPLRLLVNSPDAMLVGALRAELSLPQLSVAYTEPGASFMQAARSLRPQIALIDRIHERAAAQMEIAVLKDLRSDVRVIVLSEDPSEADASVVEQGVFYYLAVPSPDRIVAVVHAAVRSIRAEVAARGLLTKEKLR